MIELFKYPLPEFGIEIDQHISTENQIERAVNTLSRRHSFQRSQIIAGELYHLAKKRAGGKTVIGRYKIFIEKRQPGILEFLSRIVRLSGLLQRLAVDIGSENVASPGTLLLFQGLVQQNRQRIGLFTATATGAPDPNFPIPGLDLALDEFRQQPLADHLEDQWITEKMADIDPEDVYQPVGLGRVGDQPLPVGGRGKRPHLGHANRKPPLQGRQAIAAEVHPALQLEILDNVIQTRAHGGDIQLNVPPVKRKKSAGDTACKEIQIR